MAGGAAATTAAACALVRNQVLMGWYAAAVLSQRPTSTGYPPDCARTVSSATSRVFPMPASPDSKTTFRPPERTDCHAASSLACSRVRPARRMRVSAVSTASGIPDTERAGTGRISRAGLAQQQRVLLKDALCEVLQLRARVQPELIRQLLAGTRIRVERVRLPARAVEGDHQLAAEALPERVGEGQRFEFGDEVAVPARRQFGGAEHLQRSQAYLLQPGHFGDGGINDVQVRVRPSPPQPQGVPDDRRRPLPAAQPERFLAESDLVLEAVRVQLAGRKPQRIAGW